MSETKFTGGEWRIHDCGCSSFEITSDEKPCIATVSWDYTNPEDAAESLANARLLKSSRRMYASLEKLLHHLDRINPPTGAYWSGARDQEDAREALAAARGESA